MDDVGWIVPLAVMILYGILSLFNRKKKQERQRRPPPQPNPNEPKLPYENLVDQVFGGYIQRRREEYEAQSRVVVVEEDEEEVELIAEEEDERTPPPPPRRPAVPKKPEIRIIEELPAHSIELPPLASAAAWGKGAEGVSLEERVFANRRLSTGAKLVLASEILQRPRALRRDQALGLRP